MLPPVLYKTCSHPHTCPYVKKIFAIIIMLPCKKKIRYVKKFAVLFVGIFVTTYIFFLFYLTFMSQIQNFTLNHLHLRYVSDSETETNTCKMEKTNFVFIKCMKCATETMATVFRRFGYVRNLNFALPIKRNLYFGWPFPIEKRDVRESKFPYNILMEHSIYNGTFLKELMPEDTAFISIIRNPWKQFQSTFNYFALGRIGNVPGENISVYLADIQYYENIYTGSENSAQRWCIPDGFSMTKNIMSHCLGMPLGFPKGHGDISGDLTAVKGYIQDLDNAFDLVMIADYFVESLVLLKRKMCWGFKDIVYHHSNVGSYDYGLKLNGHLHEIHKNWSHVDYMLFDHMNNSFWAKVSREGPDFKDEVEHFRLIQMVVERFCFVENMWQHPQESISISSSKFGEGFNLTGEDCALMNTYMLPMLWAKYFEREGLEPENLGEPKDRPKPSKGCSI